MHLSSGLIVFKARSIVLCFRGHLRTQTNCAEAEGGDLAVLYEIEVIDVMGAAESLNGRDMQLTATKQLPGRKAHQAAEGSVSSSSSSSSSTQRQAQRTAPSPSSSEGYRTVSLLA